MSKVRLLTIVSILMLCCNAILLYKYRGRPEQDKGEGPRLEIIARLHFDKDQVEKYDVLVHEHRRMMREKDDEIRSLKKVLYNTLNDSVTVTYTRDSIIQLLADKQKEIEYINLKHFEDIGMLCRTEQKAYYKALVSDLSELFMHRRPPPRR